MEAAPVAVLGVAALLDIVLAEPPERLHPVALFGTLVGYVDRSWHRPVAAGVGIAALLPVVAAGAVGGLTALALQLHPLVGIAVAAVALFSTISLRMLFERASDVITLTEAAPADARTAVRALVGRETADLSGGELRSAAVESAAENLADGLVGPLAAFAVGSQFSLAGGVAAAAYLKAVNTLDSMLGYRSKPVGTASARLDDLLMWVPARISAGLIALAALDPAALWRARSSAGEPASPNSGWPMATLATARDVRLSKPDAYVLNPTAELPSVAESKASIRVVGVAGVLAILVTGVVVWF